MGVPKRDPYYTVIIRATSWLIYVHDDDWLSYGVDYDAGVDVRLMDGGVAGEVYGSENYRDYVQLYYEVERSELI